MMSDLVWNNFKYMLNRVLETKDINVISENSMLVIPKLIGEMEHLRARIKNEDVYCAKECEYAAA